MIIYMKKNQTRSFYYLAQKSNPSGSRILRLETLKVLETKPRYTRQVIGIDKGFLSRALGSGNRAAIDNGTS